MSKRHLIETFNITTDDVIKLKEFFQKEINSERRFEEISTAHELYVVLEDRDALTDDVLLELEPNFRKFVHYQRSKSDDSKQLELPESVVRLLCESHWDSWETVGVNLKLSEEQLKQCDSLEDVLKSFIKNCDGVSPQEMTFRLNRGLEKCGMGDLNSRIIELMNGENL